jgi:hypothetical protein
MHSEAFSPQSPRCGRRREHRHCRVLNQRVQPIYRPQEAIPCLATPVSASHARSQPSHHSRFSASLAAARATIFRKPKAQAISQEVFTALNSAMVAGLTPSGASTAATRPSLGEIVERARLAQSSGCTVTNSGESCNIPITYQGACPNGGSISVSGDLMYTLDNSGNGSDSSTLTVTPRLAQSTM